jgi:hypothetical protein
MPEISEAHRRKMAKAFRFDVAQHLAAAASRQETVTYGDLTREFGGTDRGWGDMLGGIALRCHKAGLPVLSVIVVSKQTGLPSPDARLYRDLGLEGAEAMVGEQERCFAVDWSKTSLGAA